MTSYKQSGIFSLREIQLLMKRLAPALEKVIKFGKTLELLALPMIKI